MFNAEQSTDRGEKNNNLASSLSLVMGVPPTHSSNIKQSAASTAVFILSQLVLPSQQYHQVNKDSVSHIIYPS